MSQANMLELLMVDLINEERVAAGVAPLTVDDDLNTSSETHSTWMLENDVFSHTGEGGSNSNERIRDAGYELEGSWATGENIGWQSERGDAGLEDDVRAIHESLMNSPGHRANILSANFTEVGIGIEQGDFDAATGTFDAVMVTQNFGRTDAVDDDDDDTGPGAISDTPEMMAFDDAPDDDLPGDDDPVMEDPGDDDGDDDPVVDDPDDDTPDDDDPVMEDPGDDDGDDDPVVDDPDDDTPDDDDPVMEDPGDDDGDDDPVVDDGGDTPGDDDPAGDDDGAVISREYVLTKGTISNTVTETVTVDAEGAATRMRHETLTDTADDEPFDFGTLADVFDFGAFDLDEGDEGVILSDLAFAFTGPDGMVTTDDPARLEELLADYFDDMPAPPTCMDALFA